MHLNRFARISFYGNTAIIERKGRSRFHELTFASRQRITRIVLDHFDTAQMVMCQMDLGTMAVGEIQERTS